MSREQWLSGKTGRQAAAEKETTWSMTHRSTSAPWPWLQPWLHLPPFPLRDGSGSLFLETTASHRTGGDLPAGWWGDSGLKETRSSVLLGFAGYNKDIEERCEQGGESRHDDQLPPNPTEEFDFEGLRTPTSCLRKEGSAVEWLFNLALLLNTSNPSFSNHGTWVQMHSSKSQFPHL